MIKTTHEIRHKDGSLIKIALNRGKAIKAMCTECLGFDINPKDCTSKNCPLYPWRGKINITTQKLTETNSTETM